LRAVHHPLPYKSAAERPHSPDVDAEYRRDVARAMRARAKLRHRAQVVALAGREAVEAHAEESMIQRAERGRGGAGDVDLGDGRLVGDVPRVRAPLLQEVRIALGVAHEGAERAGADVGALVVQGLTDRTLRRRVVQRADVGVVEESFG